MSARFESDRLQDLGEPGSAFGLRRVLAYARTFGGLGRKVGHLVRGTDDGTVQPGGREEGPD